MDPQYFQIVCDQILHKNLEQNGIGTLAEKTTHAVVKQYLEPDTSYHEIKVSGFVADICNQKKEIYEVQTRDFNKLRRKLEAFLEHHSVTIAYPIPSTKYISWIDKETGEISKRRKSPKRGTRHQIFPELYKIKYILPDENLHIKILMIDTEEYKYLDGWSHDKKKGSSRCDRIPTAIVEEIDIRTISDYQKLIPEGLPNKFTSKEFAKASSLSVRNAQTALNVLHHIGQVERVGKIKNAYLYERRQ